MNIGRNDPCPCGSGKKYKKCCLDKEREEATAHAVTAPRSEESEAKDFQPKAWRHRDHNAYPRDNQPGEETIGEDWDAESEEPDLEKEELYRYLPPDWPPLSTADQQVVDAWWEEVTPVYIGKKWEAEYGWVLERVLDFLDRQPRLFRYLYIHEEFLSDLTFCLAHAGRIEDYFALLKRLRSEQPELYLADFGTYDRDLIVDAIRRGRREDIAPCLVRFHRYPVRFVEELMEIIDLFAWLGYEEELYALLESVHLAIATFPKLGEDIPAHDLLCKLNLLPLLETGDDSESNIEQMGRIGRDNATPSAADAIHPDCMRGLVYLTSLSAAELGWDFRKIDYRQSHQDIGWHFTGWLHRQRGLPWISSRCLADAILEYWHWEEKRKKKSDVPFGLDEVRLERYLIKNRVRGDGLFAWPTLQAIHHFTEYLAAHAYFDIEDLTRLQSATRRYFRLIQISIGPCDPAYLICPTYEELLFVQNKVRSSLSH